MRLALALVAAVLALAGCGAAERVQEVRCLQGATTCVQLYSGGQLVGSYPDAQIGRVGAGIVQFQHDDVLYTVVREFEGRLTRVETKVDFIAVQVTQMNELLREERR